MSTAEASSRADGPVQISGLLVRRLAWAPIRVLAVISGLVVIRGILALVGRYLLVLRRRATATVEGGSLTVEVEWSILGRKFRRTRTVAPIGELEAARFENRRLYVHLLIGFGCLAVGTWVGIQWLVDGLRAGYPYLALVGAAVVAAGVLVDLVMYLVIPEGKGRSRVLLALGPWRLRLAGIDRLEAERFLEAVKESWNARATSRG
jgi:hypothetical protein